MTLSPIEIARLLEASAGAIRAEVSGLPDSLLVWRPAPAEWSPKDVIGHLIEAERRGFAGRIRRILVDRDAALERWDPEAVSRARRDDDRALDKLLGEFEGLRAGSVALVRDLSALDLARGAEHPAVGHLTVRALLHEWVFHDRNHLRQIVATVQRAIWPAMENAQRFGGDASLSLTPTA